MAIVLEEWFACVDRLSNVTNLKPEVKRLSEGELLDFNFKTYAGYINRLVLEPLEIFCCNYGFVVSASQLS